MIKRRLFLKTLMLAAGWPLAARLDDAPIRVCAVCGHEALHDGPTCLHCGAPLPPLPAAPPTEAPPADSARPSATSHPSTTAPNILPNGASAEELQWTRQLFNAGELWGAVLVARNVSALAALQGEEGAKTRAAAVVMQVECRRRLFVVRRPCPVCDGTGRRRIQIVSLKGSVIEQELPSLFCESCKGTGTWNARPLLDELSRAEAAARRAFVVEQLRRGREENRGIWLPRGAADQLNVRSIAAMRVAAGTPCATCLGFGAIGCMQCSGAGRIRCTNKNCVQGTEICPVCNGTGRSRTATDSGAIQKRCEACNGLGKRECPVCHGKGELVCDRCDGRGESLCAACRGAGEAPLCDRCEGQGFLVCTRCAGKGEVRGQSCIACGGQGVVLCPNCQGAGRVTRRR